MSKTNDTSKFDHAKLENRMLADSELDAVTGGMLGLDTPVITGNRAIDAMIKIVAENLSHMS
jgi:hypothetical protein